MIRCVVSKELLVSDKNAGDVLRMMRSGFAVRFVEDKPVVKPDVQAATRIRRKRKRGANITPEQLRQMVELRSKGLAHRIIARRFGLSVSGAGNAIRKAAKKGGRT